MSVAYITNLHELDCWSSHANQLGHTILSKTRREADADGKELAILW